MKRPEEFIVRYRVILTVVLLFLTALSLPGLLRLNITVDIQDYFLPDDPAIESQKAYERLFPSLDFVGVLVQGGDVFSVESLELIRELGRVLEETVPGAGEARSLSTLSGSLSGGVKVEFAGDVLLSDKERIEEWRRALSSSPMLNGLFFSNDYSEAWVIVPLSSTGVNDDVFETGRIAWEAVKGIDPGTMTITAAGKPVFAYRKQVELMADLIRVLIFGAVAAVLLSSLILRSFRAVVGTLGVFICSIVLVLGGQGWAGITIDNGFMAVPILLVMGISIGYAVHVHRFFHLGLAAGKSRSEAVESALNRTLRPIFFTAVTTVAAVLSFLLVNIQPIRWVGFTSALGILMAFLFSVIFFPTVLSTGREQMSRPAKLRSELMDTVFRKVVEMLEKRERIVLQLFLIITAAAIVGSSLLQVDFNDVKMMGTRLPHMKDQLLISDSDIGVGEYMNLVVTLPEDSFRRAEAIFLLEDLEDRLAGIEGVTRVSSLTEVLKEVNSLMHRRSPDFAGLPENTVSLEALVRLLDGVLPGERGNWVDDSFSHARVLVEISDFSSRKIEGIIESAETAVDEVFTDKTASSFSGVTYLMALMNQYITRGLVRSIVTALLIISFIMVLVFRSFRWGLIAMIPNVFPVLIAGGILGFAGIPLEFVTMTVAPIILGLAVDDTIHFMSFLKEDLGVTHSFQASLQRSFNSVGTAISETTLILCVTFLVFIISDINSFQNIGIITAAGMAAAYLADLLITPILVRRLTSVPAR